MGDLGDLVKIQFPKNVKHSIIRVTDGVFLKLMFESQQKIEMPMSFSFYFL